VLGIISQIACSNAQTPPEILEEPTPKKTAAVTHEEDTPTEILTPSDNLVTTICEVPMFWSIDFELSGGFAGERQRLELNHTGQLTVSDEKAGTSRQVQAPEDEIFQTASLLTDLCPFESSTRLEATCADCFQYMLQVVIDGRRYAVQTNDLALSDSELKPLTDILVDLQQRVLSEEIQP